MPVEFFDIFIDRIKANNFTDQRLKDAVNYVIDNCVYPTPSIAQFVSFDKKTKLYTYDQLIDFIDKYGGKMSDYQNSEINGTRFFYK